MAKGLRESSQNTTIKNGVKRNGQARGTEKQIIYLLSVSQSLIDHTLDGEN